MVTSAVRRAGLALGTSAALLAASVALGPPAQAAGPSLRVFDATLTEGTGGQAIVAFAVQLSAKQTKAVTFTWRTVSGTATAGTDFTAVPSGTKATIPAKATSTVLIVRVAADSIDEYSETFGVQLGGVLLGGVAGKVTLADGTAQATVLDDDASPVLSLSAADLVEGTDVAPSVRPISASLSQVSGKPISVRYALSSGTALIGSDLAARTGTLVFEPGQQSVDFTVDLVADGVDEPNETFSLTWAAPVNVQLPLQVLGSCPARRRRSAPAGHPGVDACRAEPGGAAPAVRDRPGRVDRRGLPERLVQRYAHRLGPGDRLRGGRVRGADDAQHDEHPDREGHEHRGW